MPYTCTKKFKLRYVLIAMLLLAFIIIGIILSGYTAQNGINSVANAADPTKHTKLLTNRGLNIYDTEPYRGTHTYDNLLTSKSHSNAQGTDYGDYIFNNLDDNHVSTDVNDYGFPAWKTTSVPKGQNRSYDPNNSSTYDTYSHMGFLYSNAGTVPANGSIVVKVPIYVDSNLYKAINDPLLNVRIHAYANMIDQGTGSGTDYAKSTITYNNGTQSTHVSASKTVNFPESPYSDRSYEYSMSEQITMSDCDSGAYIQLTFSDFDKRGDNYVINITKLAFRITVSTTNFIFKDPQSGDFKVIDADGTRDSMATPDMVKRGDIIFIKSQLQINDSYLTVNQGIEGDTNPAGRFYRNLMLNSEVGTARTSTKYLTGTDYLMEGVPTYTNNDMVTWQYDKAALTRIYTFTDENGIHHDLTTGYDALTAAFYVNDSTRDTVHIKCSMKDAYGAVILGDNDIQGSNSGRTFSYVIDSQLPNAPYLDTSTIFYQKYIADKDYYTKISGYNRVIDAYGNSQIESVTIGTQQEGSDAVVSAQTTTMQGLSSEIVYYRVTRLEREPNNYTAEPFTKDQATGIYCVTTPTLSLVNDRYVITGQNTIYQGMTLMLRQGDSPENYTYPKQGIYKVEFISYDYVGNISPNSSVVIMRVDVADYQFEVVTRVGSVVTVMEDNTFNLIYYALNDNNVLEPRSNATFKRGDRIVLQLDFTTTGYGQFILTTFSTPTGHNLNTSEFPYDKDLAVYLTNTAQSTTQETLYLSNNYAGDDRAHNRKFILTFRRRVQISVLDATPIYEPGVPKTLETKVYIGGNQATQNADVSVTYSENKDGPYRGSSENFPVSAGEYYYRCVLESADYYGFAEGIMTIVKATPVISELRVSPISYGDSLAVRDTVYNSTLNRFVMSDTIFCSYTYFDEITNTTRKISVSNRSSNGVYGYFSISDPLSSSNNYIKPSAGNMKVRVVFTPIIMEDQYTPKYDEDGNFIINTNYFPVTVSDVSVVVNHSTNVEKTLLDGDENGQVISEYTGDAQNIAVDIRANDDGRTIILTDYIIYTFTNVDTGITNAVTPISAGNYIVNYSLNKNLCNYTGNWTQEFIITKRELLVVCDDVISEFQRELYPSATARYYYVGGSIDYYGLAYDVAYYFYNDSTKTKEEIAVEDNLVSNTPEFMFKNMPWIAGRYVARITINEANFANENDCLIIYTINKVSALDNPNLLIEFPHLNWTTSSSGYHIDYLQPLKAISIATTQNTYLQYSYHYMDLGNVKYSWEQVQGRFIVAKERYTGDYSALSVDEFVLTQGEYAGLNAGQHYLYLYFIPSQENLVNFNLLNIPCTINVGRAQPIFSDIEASPITYGKSVQSIDDIVLSKDTTQKNTVKFKLYNDPVLGMQYYYLPQEEYTFSLFTTSTPVLPAGNNNVIITFNPNDTANFMKDNGTVSLTVNKRTLEVGFEKNANFNQQANAYIYPYHGYQNAVRIYNSAQLVKPSDNPQGSYAFYNYDISNADNNYKGSRYHDSNLVVGKYVVEYTISDPNYQGSNYYVTDIVKDNLRRTADPIISMAATMVSYGKLMSSVNFSGGSMLAIATGQRVDGTYHFNYDAGTVFDKMGTQTLKLKFVPSDTHNYNIYEGTDSGDYRISVNVTRADLSADLTLSVPQGHVYGDLDHGWNFDEVTYTAPIYTNGSNFASSKIDETYRYIDGELSINNRPMTGYFNAGVYNVTFTVKEDSTVQIYYKGSITVPMNIAKQKALMEVEASQKTFDNKRQSASVGVFLAVVDGDKVTQGARLSESVTQIFYKNGVRLSNNPSEIGEYSVEISLQSQNYEYFYGGTLTSAFTIKVDEKQIIINNLNQVYSVPRTLGISLGINSAVYTLKYYDTVTQVEYSTMPINAGSYDVHLIFDAASNNGYESSVVYKEKLVIEKFVASILTSEIISTTYTGKPNIISARTEPYNLSYSVTYRKQNQSEFTPVETLSANTDGGYHEVKFVINSTNYKGEKVIRYYILPAELTIGSHPIFGAYTYNTDDQPAVQSKGEVRFGYDKIIQDGLYDIPSESIKYLDTGTYIVNYNFTAYDELGGIDTNYKVATGRTNLTVAKQNIDGQKIIIPADIPMSVQFNNGYHHVYAVLCSNDGQCDCHLNYDASNIDKDGLIYNMSSNNKDFRIRIRYNGVSDPALSRGEYIVSAVIESKNYTGSTVFDKKLIVEKGVPEVRVKPSVVASADLEIKKVGDSYEYPTLTNDDIIGGEAFILGTNTRIGGSFTVVSGQVLQKANINLLRILFAPDDSQNFNTLEVTIAVNVVGINPLRQSNGEPIPSNANWTDLVLTSNVEGLDFANVKVVAEAIGSSYYGARLNQFELRFVDASGSSYNSDYFTIGHLAFINPSYMPDVGEQVAVRFIPFESTYGYLYNEMYGMISLPVEKANTPESFSYNLIGFDGQSFNEDIVFEILDDGDKVDIKGGSLTIYVDESKTTLFDWDKKIEYMQGQDTTVYIVYQTTNYCDIEGYAKVNIYNRIKEVEINVELVSKQYTDEHGIIVSDLAPTTNIMGIDYGHITLVIKDSQGNYTDGKEIGTYDILLTIDTGEYYGQKEIKNFTVTRKDISHEISLDSYSSVYNAVQLPVVVYKGNPLDASIYSLAYKLANASDASYLQTIGEDASQYHVRVTIDDENYYGTKVFVYTIEPIRVRIIAGNREVVFGSIEAIDAPPVEFRSATSEDTLTFGYTLYYYNNNYTITTVKPADTGIYTVRCVINDTNYISNGVHPYHEFTYTITKASVMIYALPIVLSETQNNVTYNIKYGQALSDIKMQGGEARRNNLPIAGTFSIANPAERPNAGNYTITVVFTPINANYASSQATMQIVVAKGQAQVVVGNLHAKYDGISKKDWISISVQPAGVQVRVTFTNSRGEIINEPTNAGTYFINAVSLNDNYNVAISRSADGSMTPRLVIAKAKVQMINGIYNVRPPVALDISAGDSLTKSSLSQATGYGQVYYEGFSLPVDGAFSYLQSGLIFNNAGEYETGYSFTPHDINNFDTYQGIVSITVNRAYATISVSNTSFVYGEGFSMPKFTTSPAGLSYDWGLQPNQPYVNFVEYNPSLPYHPSNVIDAGTYHCRVWITSENYNRAENYLDFTITISKKNIDLSFVDNNGAVVTQYITTYGVPLSADIKLYSETNAEGKRGYLLKDEIVNNVNISATRATRYVSTDVGRHYDSHIAPTDRGSYEVTVSIINDNYTASGNIMYVINRGIIEDVIFDTHTLENQTYGFSIVPPRIDTRPSNISYYIVYQGHNTDMPVNAGSYNIMVYFDDDNFDKKQVSAMFKINPKQITIDRITVKDKVYDGVATVEIDGRLRGVELGDQVNLTMKAATLNNDIAVGRHAVVITEYGISGLKASNYIVEKPVVHNQISIYTKVITAPKSKSYVTSPTGFNPGTTVDFAELDVKENKTNIFTKAMGVESTVVGFTIKENGTEAIMKDMVKVYVAIPSQYLGTDFEVKPAGNLAGQTLLTYQEGNYITFYTTNSGSIVFEKKEFQYGLVVTVISITVILIGIIILIILNPMHSRAKTSDTSREKAVIKRIKRGY